MNCSPPAIGPPTPSLKGRRSCRRRPPCLVSTSPVRKITTRGTMPSASRSAASQSIGTSVTNPFSPRRRLLVEDLGAAVAVVADCGLADEDLGLRGRGLDPVEQVSGADQPALADPHLRLVGEALVDLLADQVDDAVDPLERLRRRPLGGRLPGVPADGRVLRPGPLRIAGEAHDLVAPRQQGVAEGRADHPARSGDENAHKARDATYGAARRGATSRRRRRRRTARRRRGSRRCRSPPRSVRCRPPSPPARPRGRRRARHRG